MADKTSSEIIPGAPWVLIAVMGVTGAGKSTFIQTASQSPEVVVGHSLESCTYRKLATKLFTKPNLTERRHK
jgi:signal recognition particle receptor subunit beta